MKDAFIALLVLLPLLLFMTWWCGRCVGYQEAKSKDRKHRDNGGRNFSSIGLGRGLTLGQLSVKKKGGVR